MKSLIKLVMFSALAGLALGVAAAYVEVRPWAVITLSPSPESEGPESDDTVEPTATGNAEAEFPETTFNFGKMERGATMSHAFKVRNVGSRPLRVEVVSTTCKCTVGDLEKNEIPPNEESDVLLEWTAKTAAGPFRHGATLSTTDPKHSRIELTVEGDVVESSSIIPSELYFGNVLVGDTSEARVFVFSNVQQDVKVLDYKFSDEKLAEQFDVRITPGRAERTAQLRGGRRSKSYRNLSGRHDDWTVLRLARVEYQPGSLTETECAAQRQHRGRYFDLWAGLGLATGVAENWFRSQ